MTDQSKVTTKVQLGKPMSFIGIIYRNMGEGLLKEAEMSQRHLHPRSPPLAWVTAHKAGSLECAPVQHSLQAASGVCVCMCVCVIKTKGISSDCLES